MTGASRGIGRAVTLALAKAGAHVVAVARNIEGLEKLDDEVKALGANATLVPLDLRDFAGLDRVGSALFERWKKLDGLFANAGILGTLTPLSHLQPRVWDDVMAINLTANWRLLRTLDPLLRESEAGRAVFVSSGAAHFNRPYWGVYAVSKAALEAMAFTYANECSTTNIKVNVFNPGPTRTMMRKAAFPGEDPMTLPAPEELAPMVLDLLSSDCIKHAELVNFPPLIIRRTDSCSREG
ncbi:MAG TPA: SDR family NAD(P)-dependent oxidoreductase [Micropepsaceae bacterium]|nr:SDR family NAD(P)-dependent oxidoreductase [Micropepsaceae bacterium]